MLKAHLLKTRGPQSIYYADNKRRTISLENSIKEVSLTIKTSTLESRKNN